MRGTGLLDKFDINHKAIQKFIAIGESAREFYLSEVVKIELGTMDADEIDFGTLAETYDELYLTLRGYRELTAPGSERADKWRMRFKERIEELDEIATEIESKSSPSGADKKRWNDVYVQHARWITEMFERNMIESWAGR